MNIRYMYNAYYTDKQSNHIKTTGKQILNFKYMKSNHRPSCSRAKYAYSSLLVAIGSHLGFKKNSNQFITNIIKFFVAENIP